MRIRMHRVESSNLKFLGRGEDGRVWVVWQSGRTGEYLGVDEATFNHVLEHPESVGKAFNTHIKGGDHAFRYLGEDEFAHGSELAERPAQDLLDALCASVKKARAERNARKKEVAK